MKIINTLIATVVLTLSINAQDVSTAPKVHVKEGTQHKSAIKPYYQGTIVELANAGGYTYLSIKEKTEKTFWIAVSRTEAKVGDYVRFQKELVTTNFKSKALGKKFDELMFASNLEYRVSKK